MNNYFFIDSQNNINLTYNQLFEFVSKKGNYISNFKSKNSSLFFINFIKALIRSKDVILLDDNFTAEEIYKLTLQDYSENKIEIDEIKSLDQSSFLYLLKNSTSKITIYTSGTTGLPKEVIHTVQSLSKQVKVNSKFDGNVWGFAYNPTHMAGLQVFFQALFNLNTIVNLFNRDKNYVIEEVNKTLVTNISATPTFYRLLYPSQIVMNNVQKVTIGGEKSSKELYDKIAQLFPNAILRNVYASTEAGSVLSSKSNIFSINEENEKFIKIEDNILFIHQSVLGNSDSFTIENDWYNTGDVIEWIDKTNKSFVFLSRANEMINVGGYKINPNEVEESIRQFDEVNQVVVYGVPNSVLGNILTADVQLNPSCTLTEPEIKLKLKETIQPFKIPRKINFVESINYNRSGKISRNKI